MGLIISRGRESDEIVQACTCPFLEKKDAGKGPSVTVRVRDRVVVMDLVRDMVRDKARDRDRDGDRIGDRLRVILWDKCTEECGEIKVNTVQMFKEYGEEESKK